MPLYSPAGSELLSQAARNLTAPALDEHADLAEDLLGLTGSDYTGVAAARVRRAVALQVNHQLEQIPDWSVLESSNKGDRSRQYRDWLVNPLARQIVEEVAAAPEGTGEVGAGWNTLRSFRGRAS